MIQKRKAVFVVAAASFCSAVFASDVSPWSVRLFRTSCYGRCPSYEVTLFSDGRVRYKGFHWVKVSGTADSRVDLAALESVFQKIEDIDFWHFYDPSHQNQLENGNVVIRDKVYDAQFSTITVIGPRGSKSIETVLGWAKPIIDLATLVDLVSEDARRIGSKNERNEVRSPQNVSNQSKDPTP